jgi:hypothetical protein
MFANSRLAKWDGYVAESEALFANLVPPTSCAIGERKFREVLLTAAKHNIPQDHIPDYIPGVPREAVPLITSPSGTTCAKLTQLTLRLIG